MLFDTANGSKDVEFLYSILFDDLICRIRDNWINNFKKELFRPSDNYPTIYSLSVFWGGYRTIAAIAHIHCKIQCYIYAYSDEVGHVL